MTFETWCTESSKNQGDYIVTLIDRILREASNCSASDVHFQPGKQGVEVRFRIDGVLHRMGVVPLQHASQIAARLKVLAHLLTYKTDSPQEGRVRAGRVEGVDKELRISSVPTLFGERVVVRFFAPETEFRTIETLGFDPATTEKLHAAIRRRSGAVLIVGPAGSGKTTTAYALLRELAGQNGTVRSIVSLEDPVEHAIEGVAQIDVSSRLDLAANATSEKSRFVGLDRMLQYMMRQDPEIIMVGEIRDRNTAEEAFQAALTGHLLISTFHAGSTVEAVGRFYELGIETFVLRSSLAFVLCQQLLRKLCHCAEKVSKPTTVRVGGETKILNQYFEPRGCSDCGGTGYSGRIPIAEILPLENDAVIQAVLQHQDTATLRRLARQHGMVPLAEAALARLESGETSPQELCRTFS